MPLIRRSVRLSVALLALGATLSSVPLFAQGQIGPQWGGSGYGKNKIQYRDFAWQIYHSPHFNVHYYTAEEASLQKVVSFAESAYDQISRDFNFQIKDPVPLIYYATHSAFEQNNIILNFIPEGIGAFASPVRYRMVLPIDMPDTELYELISHELTHIFQYHMLFQGSLTKAVSSTPPTWFMEGMASYIAKDESARDKMFLRDAVVNDRIPSIKQNVQGFFAYRYGHALFDFVEERWGREGFLDFIYEIRNTIGARVDRAVERAFKLNAEDFDAEFRRWLRKKYLTELVETGEPGDFGRLFRNEDAIIGQDNATSPVASPSGDLVAAFSAYRGDVDVVLYDAEKRTFLRSLTKGYTNDYQYLAAQEMTLAREMGHDLAFSPDGNYLALFAKRERGRSLLLLDVLNGGTHRIYEMNDVEQQLAPAWSPDGRTIAFSGNKNGKFDIFLLDVESGTYRNFTDDNLFDGAPAFSPDGKSLTFVTVVGNGFGKLFRVDLGSGQPAQPVQRIPITTGESNDNDPTYSPDGKRLYFTSDRDGRDNIYGLDLATGQLSQHTNVVTGASMPTVLREPDGEERLVFNGFWKGAMDLYLADLDEPVKAPETVQVAQEPMQGEGLLEFKPDIEVTLDDANKDSYRGFKFFLEDAQTYVGVDNNQTFLGRVVLSFSDNLGDRRIIADLSSVDTFSNFDVVYADLSNRLQWQARLFDDRRYYQAYDPVRDEGVRDQKAYSVTGASGSLIFPFSFYRRAEVGVGYQYWEVASPILREVDGEPVVDYIEEQFDFPLIQGSLVGDSARFASWGPIAGRRWRFDAFWAPDFDDSGTLTEAIDVDARQYIPVTLRSNVALRLFAGAAGGNRPLPIYFGGLDTLRGTNWADLVGDRAFFANVEYRFPLIDYLATPFLAFQGIRGVVFFDIGSAWYDQFDKLGFYKFYDSDEKRLVDGIAAYGAGITVRFLGLDLNWDLAKRWDFKETLDTRTSFWIGTRF
jgi:Tol biopolymer transport system component